jgi:hypothetical protein
MTQRAAPPSWRRAGRAVAVFVAVVYGRGVQATMANTDRSRTVMVMIGRQRNVEHLTRTTPVIGDARGSGTAEAGGAGNCS